jgi:hypothetical protein
MKMLLVGEGLEQGVTGGGEPWCGVPGVDGGWIRVADFARRQAPGRTWTVNRHRRFALRGRIAAGEEEAVVVDDVVGVQVRDEHAFQVVESQPRVGECVQGAQAAVDLIEVAADLQRR